MPALTFIDTAGTRHQLQLSAKDQETLLQQRGRRQQEAWLLEQGYLEPDLPAETPATPDPSEAITALAAMQERLTTLQGQVDTYSTADQLGQLNLDLQKWSAQAARVSLAHAELAALADQTVTTCQSMADAAQARLDQLDGDQATMAAAIASQLTEAQATAAAAVSQTTSTIATALADAKAEALSEARAIAAQQQGPTGFAGSGVTIAMENPQETDPTSWAHRWYGRDQLVSGDSALVPTKDALRTFRYTGTSWVEGPSITPKQELVSAKISALDASTKVTTLMSGGGSSGGLGGGGGESLLSRTLTAGGSAMLSESARWAIPLAAAGLPAPDAATITLELTAADGSNAGRKLFITGKALYEPLAPSTSSFTVYSELGELVGQVDVEFSIQAVPAVLPPGLPAATLPPGVLSAQVFARITSNTSGATQFLLAGAVSWLQPNAVTPAGSTTPPQIIPAWNLI